jgi:hypothetical protein
MPFEDKFIPIPQKPTKTKWVQEKSITHGNDSPKGKKVLEAIRALRDSGDPRSIDPILIDGFNQKGRWFCIHGLEFLNPPDEDYVFLANYTLPEELRTRKDNTGGLHLLTNYINTDTTETINIDYQSVAGSLIVKNSFYVNATNLKTVGADIRLDLARRLNTPQLKEVGNNLDARMASSIKTPALSKIGGELNIFYAKNAKFPKLTHVSSLKIQNLAVEDSQRIIKSLTLESLQKVLDSPSTPPPYVKEAIVNQIKVRELEEKILTQTHNNILEIN